MSDKRPSGDVVAPLPDGWEKSGHAYRGKTYRYNQKIVHGHGRCGPYVGIQQGETYTVASSAPIVRALHDAGDLDTYRDRCEAAAWRMFDAEDEGTWPPEDGEYWLWVPEPKRDKCHTTSFFWAMKHAKAAAEWWTGAVGGTHWRPMPKPPEVKP